MFVSANMQPGLLAVYAVVGVVGLLALWILVRFVIRAIRTVGCGCTPAGSAKIGSVGSDSGCCPSSGCVGCPMSAGCRTAQSATGGRSTPAGKENTP